MINEAQWKGHTHRSTIVHHSLHTNFAHNFAHYPMHTTQAYTQQRSSITSAGAHRGRYMKADMGTRQQQTGHTANRQTAGSSNQHMAGSTQQQAGSSKHAVPSTQQAAASKHAVPCKQQPAGSRQQAAGSATTHWKALTKRRTSSTDRPTGRSLMVS